MLILQLFLFLSFVLNEVMANIPHISTIPGQDVKLEASFTFRSRQTILKEAIQGRWYFYRSSREDQGNGTLLYEHTSGGYQHTLEDKGGRFGFDRHLTVNTTTRQADFVISISQIQPDDFGHYVFVITEPGSSRRGFLIKEAELVLNVSRGNITTLNNTVAEGSSTTLECLLMPDYSSATVKPWGNGQQFGFNWYHSGPSVASGERSISAWQRESIDTSVLHLPNTSYLDAGNYRCTVVPSGYSGRHILSANRELHVLYSPRSPPQFLQRASRTNLVLPVGSTSSAFIIPFVCHPPPTRITWQKMNATGHTHFIDSNTTQNIFRSKDTSALIFTNIYPSSFGSYRLTVYNGQGEPGVFTAALRQRPSDTDASGIDGSRHTAVLVGGVTTLVLGLLLLAAALFLIYRLHRAKGDTPSALSKPRYAGDQENIYDKTPDETDAELNRQNRPQASPSTDNSAAAVINRDSLQSEDSLQITTDQEDNGYFPPRQVAETHETGEMLYEELPPYENEDAPAATAVLETTSHDSHVYEEDEQPPVLPPRATHPFRSYVSHDGSEEDGGDEEPDSDVNDFTESESEGEQYENETEVTLGTGTGVGGNEVENKYEQTSPTHTSDSPLYLALGNESNDTSNA